METQTETKELTITRIFDAPRKLVWEAWMNQKHIEQWWGPKGFTNPVCEWDAQKGKKIYIEMKAPDGVHYPMNGEFLEILEPTKIVFTSGALDAKGDRLFDILNTITFVEQGDKTKLILDFKISNIKPEGLQYIGGMEMGWNMSLDKLIVLLDYIKQ